MRKDLIYPVLFVLAGAQGCRLFWHWQAGDLRAMTFWGEGNALPAVYAAFIVVWLLLSLYELFCRIIPVPPLAQAAVPGGRAAVARAPSGVGYRLIGHLKAQERQLRQHYQQEKERAERQELLNQKIIFSMESALITADQNGKIISFNPAAETLFQQPAGSMLDQPFTEIFDRSPQLSTLLTDCLKRNSSLRRQEFLITRRDGHVRHVGAALTPIRQSDGTATGALCLLTDLTETLELQRRVRMKENLAALGEMSAGIAHEFKNALATIGGYAQLVEREAETSEMREYIQTIRAEVHALTQIVANFLEFAKPGALVMEEIALSELVENGVRDLQAEDVFAHVGWEISGTFGRVSGDRLLLKQALQNLLRNAAEAIPQDWPERRVRVSGRIDFENGHRQCLLEIEDTGVGLAEENLEKIFRPFFTTKSTGTGLGLAIVQKSIVLHNGRIFAACRTPAPGLRFTLTLPAL